MDDNFLDDKKTPTEQKFTIGDKEYSQDELNDLVSKGNQYNDIETRFNTKLDKVVPEFTRASQERAELKAKLEGYERTQLEQRAQQGQLSQAELIQKAKQEAAGIGLITDDNVQGIIKREIESYRLNDAVNTEVNALDKMGINADSDVIKRYMQAMGENNSIEDAVKDLYGPQVKMYQETELAKTKQSGMYTEGNSNAGGFRLPDNVKVGDDNIGALLAEALGSNS